MEEKIDIKILISEAEKHVEEGKLKEARLKYIEARKIDEKNYSVLFGLAEVYRGEGRIRSSIGVFKTANKFYPNDSSILHHLGYMLAGNGRLKEGLDYLNQAGKIDPNDPGIVENKGLVHLVIGKKNLKKFSQICDPKEAEKYKPLIEMIEYIMNGNGK